MPLAHVFAVPGGELQARHLAALRPLAPWRLHGVTGALDPAVPAALPPHLLLLPQGLLPGVLALSPRLRSCRGPSELHGRDPLPADPPEPPSLRVLPRAALPDHPAVGGDSRHRLPRWLRGRSRHPDPSRERVPARRLHPVVSLVPAPVRRRARHVLEVARPLPGVEARLPPQ